MSLTNTNHQRRDKINYYLDLAETAAQNSTCMYKRCGAIIVGNDDTVVTTGYTGAPRGRQNCVDMGVCYKDIDGFCRGVHAEANAVISSSRRDMKGGTMYIVRMYAEDEVHYVEDLNCCKSCKMLLINSGLRDVYVRVTKDTYVRQTIMDWVDSDDTLTSDSVVGLVQP